MSETRAHAFLRFFRTPKGIVTLILVAFVGMAGAQASFARVMPGIAAAMVIAGVLEAAITAVLHKKVHFPSGAVLSALFVCMILSPFEPWWVAAATSAIAVVSKYLLRTRSANAFNPAALALIVSFYAFHTGQSWWGALPELPLWTIVFLIAAGWFIADRINKMPLVLTFLGVYFALFSVMAYAGNPRAVVEIFRAPDLHMALFFAFFMLTDPPTAPIKYSHQIFFGTIVAIVSFTLFETSGVVYYLLAGLMAGNAWETWRRLRYTKNKKSASTQVKTQTAVRA